MDQLQTIWAATRENIRPQMTGLSFHAWIDVAVPLALQNGVLILEVPTPDIQKTLTDFYFESLYKAAKAKGCTPQAISYRVKSGNFPNYKFLS